jgi:hypothetical protein
MSIIVFLVCLMFLAAFVKVAWAAFKFGFVLLHGCDHKREVAGAVTSWRYGVEQ